MEIVAAFVLGAWLLVLIVTLVLLARILGEMWRDR